MREEERKVDAGVNRQASMREEARGAVTDIEREFKEAPGHHQGSSVPAFDFASITPIPEPIGVLAPFISDSAGASTSVTVASGPVTVEGYAEEIKRRVARHRNNSRPTGTARSTSHSRSVSISSVTSETRKHLRSMPNVKISTDSLYTVLWKILYKKFSQLPTHPIADVKSSSQFRVMIAEHIKSNEEKYRIDLALEISEIVAGKRKNRFIGRFRQAVDAFIKAEALKKNFSKAGWRIAIVGKILDFLSKENLTLYYQFIESGVLRISELELRESEASELELRAIVELYQINITIFSGSSQISIVHNKLWPRVYLDNPRPGVYRYFEPTTEEAKLFETPPSASMVRESSSSSLASLRVPAGACAALNDTEAARGTDAHLVVDRFEYHPAEQALIMKFFERVAQAVTGSTMSLDDVQNFVVDRFAYDQKRYEYESQLQRLETEKFLKEAELRLLKLISYLLDLYKKSLESNKTVNLDELKALCLQLKNELVVAACEEFTQQINNRFVAFDEESGLLSLSSDAGHETVVKKIIDKFQATLEQQLMVSYVSRFVSWPDQAALGEIDLVSFFSELLTGVEKEIKDLQRAIGELNSEIAALHKPKELQRVSTRFDFLMEAGSSVAAAIREAHTAPVIANPNPMGSTASAFGLASPTSTQALEFGDMEGALTIAHPGVRLSVIRSLLREGLPLTTTDEELNTLLHIALANPLERYTQQLKEIVAYLIQCGARVSTRNRFNLRAPALITTKINADRDADLKKAAQVAEEILELCSEVDAFEQQGVRLLALINHFVSDAGDHLKAYKQLKTEREKSSWFKMTQSSSMKAKREQELKSLESSIGKLVSSPHHHLVIQAELREVSNKSYWGAACGSKLHAPLAAKTAGLTSAYDVRRAELTAIANQHQYRKLMRQEMDQAFQAQITYWKTETASAKRELAQARVAVAGQGTAASVNVASAAWSAGSASANNEVAKARDIAEQGTAPPAGVNPPSAARSGLFAVKVESNSGARADDYLSLEEPIHLNYCWEHGCS